MIKNLCRKTGKLISILMAVALMLPLTAAAKELPAYEPTIALIDNLRAMDVDGTQPATRADEFIVSFDPLDGETGYQDFHKVMVPDGGKVPRPADPVRLGYLFKGWAYAFDGDDAPVLWNFATDVVTENNTMLWAVWEAGYIVAFDPDDDVTQYPDFYKITVPINGKVTSRPSNPVKSGYRFAGWYHYLDKNDRPVLWNFATDIVEDNMELWGAWTEVSVIDNIPGRRLEGTRRSDYNARPIDGITIGDNETPLANIEDNDTPLSSMGGQSLPATGDSSGPSPLYIVTAIGSLLVISLLVPGGKKRTKRRENS